MKTDKNSHTNTAVTLCFQTATTRQTRKSLNFSQPRQVLSAWLVGSDLVDNNGNRIDLHSTCEAMEVYAQKNGLFLCGYIGYEARHPELAITSTKSAVTGLPDLFLCLFDQCHENCNSETASIDDFSSDNFIYSEDQEAYANALKQVKNFIHAGDCYQINYTQHFKAAISSKNNARKAFFDLSSKFEAPYAAYINTGDGEVLCFSPEQFIGISADGKVSTKPIKGTAPRGKNAKDDDDLRHDLLNSDKNRAENLMIVDLLRNDLSKFCEPNSVKVSKLFDIESYTNVHHLVSTINGQLKPEYSRMSALLSAFPGGSITGAPKLRAMQIINDLETTRRNVYCGSAFYLKPTGEMDSNIMIRTIAASKSELHAWSGGGIVADSVTAEEYQESLDKIGTILKHFEKS